MNAFAMIAEAISVAAKRPEEAAMLFFAAFLRLLSGLLWALLVVGVVIVYFGSLIEAFKLLGVLYG